MSTAHAARGDFDAGRRLLPVALLACVIGLLATGAAWLLLAMIHLFTNLFFFQTFSWAARSPATHTLGAAGLDHPRCEGVLALTDDDEVNLVVVMTAALIRPSLPVIARTVSAAIEHRMRAFGSPAVVNPFDRFGDRLRLALHAPASYQLMSWLVGGPGAELPEQGSPPATGATWVPHDHGSSRGCLCLVAGVGRFRRSRGVTKGSLTGPPPGMNVSSAQLPSRCLLPCRRRPSARLPVRPGGGGLLPALAGGGEPATPRRRSPWGVITGLRVGSTIPPWRSATWWYGIW